MYCKEHNGMIRCDSLQKSACKKCGKEFVTASAPPLNYMCEECANKLNCCEYCGKSLTEVVVLNSGDFHEAFSDLLRQYISCNMPIKTSDGKEIIGVGIKNGTVIIKTN